MASYDNAGISVTISVVFLLEQTLHGLIDGALEIQQQEEDNDFLLSQGLLYGDTSP